MTYRFAQLIFADPQDSHQPVLCGPRGAAGHHHSRLVEQRCHPQVCGDDCCRQPSRACRFVSVQARWANVERINLRQLDAYRYEVGFVGMVLPGDELCVKLTHVAMKDGRKVIKVETINQRGEKVIDGTAEVLQPPTAYV